MSEVARAEFDEARIQQTTQNDARRIRQRVEAAQQNPSRASVRWPFELVQNAHDAGPRDSNDRVEINFILSDDQLMVSHTGKPFVAQELAALLSGGSSKEFDSDETTGRFGTGFLVTHALSTRVDVDGILATQEGSEVFHIELMRDGDEESIVRNIELANSSLENAKAVSDEWVANNPTAKFTYYNPDDNVVRRGLDRLEEALPYLYATCSRLGRVRIERFGNAVCFEPAEPHKDDKGDFVINNTKVSIASDHGTSSVTAVRINRKGGKSALLTVLENCGDQERRVRLPSVGFAKVFVTFPIAGTDFLPFNVVLDGSFAPQQERDGIAMHDADKALIDEALSAFPALIQHAVDSNWGEAHLLAHLAIPARPLSGESESGEMPWWHEVILRVAEETAAKPIVKTETGSLLPALSDPNGQYVSFLVPGIDADASERVDYDTVHDIANSITSLNLPSKEIAQSWGQIAGQWAAIGVPADRLGFSELTDWLKNRANRIDDLPVQENCFTWLARLFLLAADMNDQNVREMVNGLLPDQYGEFRNTESDWLYKDEGISEEIKDIANDTRQNFREMLLHNEMLDALMAPGYEGANELIRDLLDGDHTEIEAIDKILDALEEDLPDDDYFDEDTGLVVLRASSRLISYLAANEGNARIRRCPLLTAASSITYLSGSQQILAPKLHWPASAQPYSDLYTENRLLSDRYCDDDDLTRTLDHLIAIRLVIEAPLFEGRRAEVEDVNLLREMSHDEQDLAGVTVRDASFGQIAFLATDLVQRCGQDAELAKLLLDFVLNVAARESQSWRKAESVVGSRSGERVNLSLYGATWPFELKVRSWIPVARPDEAGIAAMPANESNLRDMLEPSWLKGNRDAVDLLHRVFGFRQLTLILDSLGDEIEDDLVELLQDPELVKAAAANPDAVKFASDLESTDISLDSIREIVRDMETDEGLVEHLANRREQKRRVQENQNLGSSVEELVKENLEQAGFSVRRTGVGHDFEIAAEMGDVAKLHLAGC